MKTYELIWKLFKTDKTLRQDVDYHSLQSLVNNIRDDTVLKLASKVQPHFSELLEKADKITNDMRENMNGCRLETIPGFDCVGNEATPEVKTTSEPIELVSPEINQDAVTDALTQIKKRSRRKKK